MNDEMNEPQNDSDTNDSHAQDTREITELAECIAQRDSFKEKFLRVQADYDNFTKRNEKERLQWRDTLQSALLLDILPTIDDFDRAFEQQSGVDASVQNWLAGFEMIRKSLQKFLEKYHVKEIPAALPFDPEYHEALMQVESPDHKSGDIVSILQKGYTLRDQVLRPAKVSVAK